MKKKYCRECKILIKGDECPICKRTDFTENFQGRLFITDANKSEIAQKLSIKQSGEYAIKVR
ncbi:DNA-directed RNA polymerase subunit E'' [Candidatus Woesearchaeota archaeon]|nr:DNA-directed RNA polymerase subunit E'' [Candidatus Woesearchaeota archaeon]